MQLGKIRADALGDIVRGIEIVEHTASAASLTLGETQQQVYICPLFFIFPSYG